MESQFYNKEGLTLLKELEDSTVDLVLTDPPYIISRESGMNNLFNAEDKSKAKYGDKFAIQTDYGDWDSKFTLDVLNKFIQEYYRVLKPGGTCIIFFDLWKIESLKVLLEDSKFYKLRFIEWIKTNPVPINSKISYLTNSREIALCCNKKGKSTFNSKYDNGIYEYPIYQGVRNVDRIHPTQKSLPLFEDIIKKHTNKNDLVLDTFGGSATTYIASLKTKRNCISCEVDLDYYNKSKKRIEYHMEHL
jgi:site-specific DNA-methyltransferase (adenine-specific)|tara:strand:+ start:544 stop:1284 length:741 start_codon:yes stop_codon:yes gene_type:complete